MEKGGASLEKLSTKTKKLKNDAKSLLQEAGQLVNENSVTASFEDLASNLNILVKEYPYEHVQFLMVIDLALRACNLMLQKWDLDGGLHEGRMWDAWVQSINMLMQHHDLPSTVRIDTRAKEVNSKFVLLIEELQKHIPQELRRHDHSSGALAKAIQRARKTNWWLGLIPSGLREKFALDLELTDERANRYARFKHRLRSLPGWVETSTGRFKFVGDT